MRSIATGVGVLLIALATFFIIASIQVNSTLYNEVVVSTNEAIYQAEHYLYDQKSGITSNEEFVDDFNTNLLKQLPDGRGCTVKVYGVDYEKGLLDVSVLVTYKNFYGMEREVETRRTMVIDENTRDDDNDLT